MKERKGDWIQTISGIAFYPLEPRPEEIQIYDIAHALSHQCRFAGHCRQFYSVAEHSVRVSRTVSPEFSLWGLLHDAAEAYLVDLPRPIKKWCEMGRLYQEIEDNLMLAICARFGLDPEMPAAVKEADTVLLVTEKRDLMVAQPKPWEAEAAEPLPERIYPQSPYWAKVFFLERFQMLGGQHLGV